MESSCSLLLQFTLALLFSQGLAIFCSQCESENLPTCEPYPPSATNCTHCQQMDDESNRCLIFKEYKYCITFTKFVNDSKTSFTRACSLFPMTDNCNTVKEDGNTVKFCYTSCDTDGCNTAAPSGMTPCHGITTSLVIILLMVSVNNMLNL